MPHRDPDDGPDAFRDADADASRSTGTSPVRMIVHDGREVRGGMVAEAAFSDADWADGIGARLAGGGAGEDDPAPGERLRERTLATIGEGGLLETVAGGGRFRFEPRPQQEEMAGAVADAVEAGEHLVVEAATGVGKSLAYLTPLVLHALRAKSRVMVSTHTIALQEQLTKKDIPLLRDTTGTPFRAVLVKGRANYLCRRRLKRAHRQQAELFPDPSREALEEIFAWAQRTEDGSLQELGRQPPADVWMAVCAEQGNCLGAKCPEAKRCFFQRARARMLEAELLVVNHSLFFSDMAMRLANGGGHGFLPPVAAVVLDEAHTVEDTASDYLGIHLSQAAFELLLRRLYVPDTGKGLLGALRAGDAAHDVERLWRSLPGLFSQIAELAEFRPEDSQKTLKGPLPVQTDALELMSTLSVHLKTLLGPLQEDDPESWAELRSLKARAEQLADGLECFLSQEAADHVYWLEREGKRRQLALRSAPVEVGPILEQALWGDYRSVVLTSATLAVAGKLDYVMRRLGAPEGCGGLCLGSPFDHRRQMELYLATDIPAPGNGPAGAAYLDGLARGILAGVRKTRGRAFVLFTSADTMRRAEEALRGPIAEEGMTLLVQGRGLSRNAMLEIFRKAEKPYVLFGLDSFWMGVDVRGDALGNVIITRLPFAVPDHPVTEARLRRIRERGGNPFLEYSLPEAVLKFRQGVGRLIRSKDDRGVVVVLDSRIKHKYYGKIFLGSLPACPVGWLRVGGEDGGEEWELIDEDIG